MRASWKESLDKFEAAKFKLEKIQKKESLMLGEIDNLKQIVDFRTKSSFETNREYEITLEENRRLYSIITSQRDEVEQLLDDKKNFNMRTLSIITENTINEKKLYRKTEECDRLYIRLEKAEEEK